MTETAKLLEWGRQPPEGVTLAWGARTIYKYHPSADLMVIDILWDRKANWGTREELADLLEWVNTKGMEALKQRLAGGPVTGDSSMIVEAREGEFVIEASPQGSYGYLYIVAYVKP